jgi:hypothetical protein
VWRGGKLCAATRMNNNGIGRAFIAAASGGRARVARIYTSPCMLRCCAKLPSVYLFGAGGEATGEWRWRRVEAIADSGPRGESHAQSASLLVPTWVWIRCAGRRKTLHQTKIRFERRGCGGAPKCRTTSPRPLTEFHRGAAPSRRPRPWLSRRPRASRE